MSVGRRLKVAGCVFATIAFLVPTSAGQDASQSDSLASRIDAVFEEWSTPSSPGCTLGVYRRGRIVHSGAYGMANLDHDVPLTTSSVFHVASLSKQFTAAAVALLALEGRLSLDDDVRKYVGELPDFGHRITLRHLVHHTSGLRDQWALLGLAGWRYSRDLITDGDVLEMTSRQRDLNFEPGARHLYCNTGYTLLAIVVSRVSGQSFREFTTSRIFSPLGMTQTHFRDSFTEIVKGQAYGYVPEGDSFRLSVTNFDTAGATSLLTTVEDLARWDANFYDWRVGGEGLQNLMLDRGVLNDGEELDYAFGLVHGEHRGLTTVGHGGSDAGYRANLVRFPEQELTVACLCNLGSLDPGALARRVAEEYLAGSMTAEETADLRSAPEVALTAEELQPLAGLYWNHEDDSARPIVFKEGRLHAVFGAEARGMRPIAGGRFVLESGPRVVLRFERPVTGAAGLSIEPEGGGWAEILEAVEVHSPTSAEIEAFAGNYGSDEMEAIYRLRVENGGLVLHRLKADPVRLQPALKDVFFGQIGTVRFQRDASDRVTGFVLNAGRVRNVKFSRAPGVPVDDPQASASPRSVVSSRQP